MRTIGFPILRYQGPAEAQGSPASGKSPQVRIGKTFAVCDMGGKTVSLNVFTVTLNGETIELLPLRTWSQLDRFKWTARGILPAEPAGLEIAPEHVSLAGQSVSIIDPDGCEKLERNFSSWLAAESLELNRKRSLHSVSAFAAPCPPPETQPARFHVELDKRGQVHVHCVQGRDTLASVGLTVAGFNSLCAQGLMRKPHTLRTGALHDWVELDGQLCSFEKGRNDAARLEQLLNEAYLPKTAAGIGKEIVVLPNAASSTGFDIQFPILVGGVPHNQKQHLNQETLELLRDAVRCGLLHKDIVIKLVPPNLVFKLRTPEGGEKYFPPDAQHTVRLADDDGREKAINLSQPLNLLRVSAAELTAVFNHPVINQHTKETPVTRQDELCRVSVPLDNEVRRILAPSGLSPAPEPKSLQAGSPKPEALAVQPASLLHPLTSEPKSKIENVRSPSTLDPRIASQSPIAAPENKPIPNPVAHTKPLPNLWLKELVPKPSLQPDWFACLAYTKMAEHCGNSTEGKFGPNRCWFISLGQAQDIDNPAFKGVFLTEKGSLGFLNGKHMARFCKEVAFLGTRDWALEGVQVDLLAVGLDAHDRLVFILTENFRDTFGVPDAILAELLELLSDCGVVIVNLNDALGSHEPIEVIWTVPADQADPNEPQALENLRPK